METYLTGLFSLLATGAWLSLTAAAALAVVSFWKEDDPSWTGRLFMTGAALFGVLVLTFLYLSVMGVLQSPTKGAWF